MLDESIFQDSNAAAQRHGLNRVIPNMVGYDQGLVALSKGAVGFTHFYSAIGALG